MQKEQSHPDFKHCISCAWCQWRGSGWHVDQEPSDYEEMCHVCFNYCYNPVKSVGQDGVVGIATSSTGWTDRGSNPGRGETFRIREDWLWVPGLFPRGKATVAWPWPSTQSIVEVKEKVELYFYSPSHFISSRSTFILSYYLRVDFPSGLFRTGFPTKILTFSHHSYMPKIPLISSSCRSIILKKKKNTHTHTHTQVQRTLKTTSWIETSGTLIFTARNPGRRQNDKVPQTNIHIFNNIDVLSLFMSWTKHTFQTARHSMLCIQRVVLPFKRNLSCHLLTIAANHLQRLAKWARQGTVNIQTARTPFCRQRENGCKTLPNVLLKYLLF
jgi:hypothetical protein